MERVLYVDDDQLVRKALVRALRRIGICVDAAECATEAVAMVREQEYAVVVTDYSMPDVDGLMLIEQLRPLAPHTSYVLASGRRDLAELAKGCGMRTLAKPWSMKQLFAEVSRGTSEYRERRGASSTVVRQVICSGEGS